MSLGGVTIAPFERYLEILWERGGSDLLITAFSPPLIRGVYDTILANI